VCGYEGATLKHPGWKDGEVEWEPFPIGVTSARTRLLPARSPLRLGFVFDVFSAALREIQTWQIHPIKRIGPLSEVQKWGVVLVGMHLRLVRLLLELWIEKKDY
jgi:hypothetical protein